MPNVSQPFIESMLQENQALRLALVEIKSLLSAYHPNDEDVWKAHDVARAALGSAGATNEG